MTTIDLRMRKNGSATNGATTLASLLGGLLISTSALAADLHVAKSGSDDNPGTKDAPFLTISKAAKKAEPGDVVTVHEGTYREWVSPARGGLSEDQRIVYQAAPGEDVRLLGSEVAKGWVREGEVWRLAFATDTFGESNPFNIGIRHPEFIEEDEEGEGWGWLRYGRELHRGDVYLNGDGLTEKTSADALSQPMTWRTETSDGETQIWANFGDADPNAETVELAVRPYAFYPEQSGLGFVTVRGFTIMNVANHWAPPTEYQPGSVGANGGHHWIIEDNLILNGRAVCVSLGMPTGEADRDASGYHIVRNNIIMRCGQGAIAGQSWNSHSLIENNHIEDINHRMEFGGFETAAIKFHGAVGSVISGNYIANVRTDPEKLSASAAHGIWIDFRNENVRLSRNLIRDVDAFAILLEANWTGPFLVDNNIVDGGGLGLMSNVGDAWAHNLFIDTYAFWWNQQYGDRPPLKDARWMNNIFVGSGLADARSAAEERLGSDGLAQLIEQIGDVFDLPADRNYRYSHNAYLNGANGLDADPAQVKTKGETRIELISTSTGVNLKFKAPRELARLTAPRVDAQSLELAALDPDGAPTSVNVDFMNVSREAESAVGPFASLKRGMNEWAIYTYPEDYAHARALLGAE